jgi:subtilisin family serine protease
LEVQGSSPLDLVKLPSLMAVTSGRPEIRIGLVDGPVAVDHPDLARENVRSISAARGASHAKANGAAYQHGTFVAGILAAKRTSPAPGICPQCTLLVRSIFPETTQHNGHIPTATPENLARAILECIEAGARIVNLSVALAQTSPEGERQIQEVLDHAARRGVLVVAAAGNAGSIGSSPITRHPGAIPVVAYDSAARPMGSSNLGASIGRRGLGAPGDRITSLGSGSQSQPLASSGTSAAAPFVSGAIALLWSMFPAATAAQIRMAIMRTSGPRRVSVVPPLLDAWRAYQAMKRA